MTNKLVVIINSLKVPKIKKMLLCEMKFLVPNYSCLQNPWLGGYRPQIPVLSVLCPQLNLLNPPPNKIPRFATVATSGTTHLQVARNAACCLFRSAKLCNSVTQGCAAILLVMIFRGMALRHGQWLPDTWEERVLIFNSSDLRKEFRTADM